MTNEIRVPNTITCPVCGGSGKERHTYRYKPQHRNDQNSEAIERSSLCGLCGGKGAIDQRTLDDWQRIQAYSICPSCKGQGGKYVWSWDESYNRTQKRFEFEPCTVCTGKQRLLPAQMAAYERERRRLRLWGVGCTVVFIVVGLLGVTQLTALVMARTPWLQCCAPPHVVFVTGMGMLVRNWGWLSL